MGEEKLTPKAFISYSWTNDDHMAWVEKLAERLMSDGVEVVFDIWDLKKGHDKYVFMETMVKDPSVTKVLAVCDQLYADKADGREGGVGTESQIISAQLYEQVTQEKFIALVREKDDNGKPYLPIFFANRMYYDFSDDDKFEDEYDHLLRDLHGVPKKRRPPLGKAPQHILEESSVRLNVAAEFQRLQDALMKDKPHKSVLLSEYLEKFIDSLEEFRLTYKKDDDVPFDERVVESIKRFRLYRDNFVDAVFLVSSRMGDDDWYDEFHGFLERLMAFDAPVGRTAENVDNYRFIMYEIFLYFLAALIRQRKYRQASQYIEDSYHAPRTFNGTDFEMQSADHFNHHVRVLEEWRKERLYSNSYSIMADVVEEGATHPKVPFSQVFQIDFLLYLRPYFPQPGHFARWYPRLISRGARGNRLELFAKATTDRGITPLKHLLKVTSVDDLMDKLEAYGNNEAAVRMLTGRDSAFISFDQLLNVPELNRVTGRKLWQRR